MLTIRRSRSSRTASTRDSRVLTDLILFARSNIGNRNINSISNIKRIHEVYNKVFCLWFLKTPIFQSSLINYYQLMYGPVWCIQYERESISRFKNCPITSFSWADIEPEVSKTIEIERAPFLRGQVSSH